MSTPQRAEGFSATGASTRFGTWSRAAGTALLILSFSATGCRFERIWSGLEAQPDGTLKLAAEEPLCGCLSVVNGHTAEVRLRATQHDATVGEVTLRPAERQRFRFDWGGPGLGDHYQISVSSLDGKRLDVGGALEVEERPRWVECETASCEFGELQMSTVGKDQ